MASVNRQKHPLPPLAKWETRGLLTWAFIERYIADPAFEAALTRFSVQHAETLSKLAMSCPIWNDKTLQRVYDLRTSPYCPESFMPAAMCAGEVMQLAREWGLSQLFVYIPDGTVRRRANGSEIKPWNHGEGYRALRGWLISKCADPRVCIDDFSAWFGVGGALGNLPVIQVSVKWGRLETVGEVRQRAIEEIDRAIQVAIDQLPEQRLFLNDKRDKLHIHMDWLYRRYVKRHSVNKIAADASINCDDDVPDVDAIYRATRNYANILGIPKIPRSRI